MIQLDYNSIILDAGLNKFQEEPNSKKNFFKLDNGTFLIDEIVKTYKGISCTVIVLNETDTSTINYLDKNIELKIIKLKNYAKGALASAAIGASSLVNDGKPLLVCPGDSLVSKNEMINFLNLMLSKNADAGTIVFPSSDPKYSYIRTGFEGEVLEVAEKKVISKLATAGVFYFKTKEEFMKACNWSFVNNVTTDNNYYLAPSLNYFITMKKIIRYYKVELQNYNRFSTILEAKNSRSIMNLNDQI